MPEFESLNDEIDYQRSILQKERLHEREEFLNKSKNKNRIKNCSLEDQKYIAGVIWRIQFSFTPFQEIPKFLKPGNPVLISGDSEKIFGNVYNAKKNEVTIQVRGDFDWESDLYQIEEWFQESTYDSYFEILNFVKDRKNTIGYNKLKWSLGYAENEKPNPPSVLSEQTPTEKFFSISDYGFIFGPPGTGKTTLLMDLSNEILKENKSILVLCPTNFACDYIVELGIKNNLRMVRLGNSTKIREEIYPYHIDFLVGKDSDQKQISGWLSELKSIQKKIHSWKRNFGKEERDERKELRKEARFLLETIRNGESNIRNRILDSADIIVSTFSGFANEFKKGRTFDYVFIDEATQAPPPGCYMSMFLGDKTFFFGDPKQLPVSYSHPELMDLKSFLEKAIELDNGNRVIFLNEQYRMEPEILFFPNESYYGGKIKTHPNRLKISEEHKQNTLGNFLHIHETMDQIFGSNSKLIWIDTAGSDTEEETPIDGSSYFNETEVELILNLFLKGIPPSLSTVISPYKEQVEKLNKAAAGSFLTQTIDSYQGRESDIVLLSFVRSNALGEVGFLLNQKRLNVALTRAKFYLILIGDSTTLCQNADFQKLYKVVETYGEVRSIYEFLDV